MIAKIIDGKAFAAGFRQRIGAQVGTLVAEHGLTPGYRLLISLTIMLSAATLAAFVVLHRATRRAGAASNVSEMTRPLRETPR